MAIHSLNAAGELLEWTANFISTTYKSIRTLRVGKLELVEHECTAVGVEAGRLVVGVSENGISVIVHQVSVIE
jgi:hypothetical protein